MNVHKLEPTHVEDVLLCEYCMSMATFSIDSLSVFLCTNCIIELHKSIGTALLEDQQ